MPHIKLVIHVRVDAFHICLYAYMAISCHNLHFCPLTLDIFHAPFKSFSLHGITAGHFADLNNLEVNYFVVALINHGVGAIFCVMPWAVTATMSRKPHLFVFQVINYWK